MVLPGIRRRRSGRIINITSLAGFAPGVEGHSLYPGAKSLMIKFSQEFAQANGTAAVMAQAPRRLFQTADQVAAAALRANDRGQVVAIPGWWNAVAAGLLQYMPQGLVRAILMRGSARYHLSAE